MAGFIRTRAFLPTYPNIDNISRPDKVRFFNLKEMLANFAANALWGKGIIIDFSESVLEKYKTGIKRLRKIIKENDLHSIMYELEKRIIVNGLDYITLEMYEGKPIFALSELNFPGGYGRQFMKPTIAVIWKRILYDIAEIPCIEIWTINHVRRIKLRDFSTHLMPFLTKEELSLGTAYIPTIWKHDMGFLPVWQVKNKPNWGLVADPDDSAVEPLQLQLDKLTESLMKELEKNQTRVIANVREYQNLAEGEQAMKDLMNDFIFNMGNRSDLIKNPINVIQGDPKIQSYIFGIKEIINIYFQAAGYAPILSATNNVEKTATQTYGENSLTIQTIRNKRQQRINLLRDMIEKLILMDKKHGAGDIYPDIEDISITIPENIVISVDDMLRRAQIEVPLGITQNKHLTELLMITPERKCWKIWK